MFRRLRTFYHEGVAVALATRVTAIEVLCSDCKFDEDLGFSVRCGKHHDKLFDLEVRAEDHFFRTY